MVLIDDYNVNRFDPDDGDSMDWIERNSFESYAETLKRRKETEDQFEYAYQFESEEIDP